MRERVAAGEAGAAAAAAVATLAASGDVPTDGPQPGVDEALLALAIGEGALLKGPLASTPGGASSVELRTHSARGLRSAVTLSVGIK